MFPIFLKIITGITKNNCVQTYLFASRIICLKAKYNKYRNASLLEILWGLKMQIFRCKINAKSVSKDNNNEIKM